MRRACAVLVLLVGSAVADDGTRITLDVGDKLARKVGNATGWFCDHPELVHAQVTTIDEINYFVVIGAKEGTTQCRVGTDPSRASYVFHVEVKSTAKRARSKQR